MGVTVDGSAGQRQCCPDRQAQPPSSLVRRVLLRLFFLKSACVPVARLLSSFKKPDLPRHVQCRCQIGILSLSILVTEGALLVSQPHPQATRSPSALALVSTAPWLRPPLHAAWSRPRKDHFYLDRHSPSGLQVPLQQEKAWIRLDIFM